MTTFKQILVPVDFSSHSARALEEAIDLAKLFGARLSIVHVEQPHVPPVSAAHMPPLWGMEGVEAAARAVCEKQLEETAARARAAGVAAVATELLEGIPWRQIVELAERDGSDLIVIGTHGRSGLARALLGSVAERVVRKARCNVLAVRGDQAADDAAIAQAARA